LTRSIKLGTDFLLAHQRPEGNFDYEYDWRAQALSADDQETRQAGALWGLSLIYSDDRRPQMTAAIERGLEFFDRHSRLVNGARCTVYPGSGEGGTGTVALVALAHIEYLRASAELQSERRALFETRLGEYLQLLLRSVEPSGLWYGNFDVDHCKPHGQPSPYSDGEALLALVKAAKYLGHTELLPAILRAAAAGKRINVDQALAKDADSDVTKGFYQWGTMAFYELATSEFPDTKSYGDTVLQLADWVIDVHTILTRTRNTGYAFEGITHAYALAKQRGDRARQAKYGCVVDIGIEHLLSWQVGGPRPNRYTAHAPNSQALGGIQNSAFEPALRIDVTQHQIHAMQLARQYVY
jgi:UDP-N-acetylmuramoyl-tripeptide--D-alanyl-D-alanine ligase